MEVLQGQVSVFDFLGKTTGGEKVKTKKEKLIDQLNKAISKGIIPGAEVIFDKDEKQIYTIMSLNVVGNGVLGVVLHSKNCIMDWEALSNRLSVVGHAYDSRKS